MLKIKLLEICFNLFKFIVGFILFGNVFYGLIVIGKELL